MRRSDSNHFSISLTARMPVDFVKALFNHNDKGVAGLAHVRRKARRRHGASADRRGRAVCASHARDLRIRWLDDAAALHGRSVGIPA
jgi:hypothetical protein